MAQGDNYQGISPGDVLSREQQEGMDYQQRFNLIKVEPLWDKLDACCRKNSINVWVCLVQIRAANKLVSRLILHR